MKGTEKNLWLKPKIGHRLPMKRYFYRFLSEMFSGFNSNLIHTHRHIYFNVLYLTVLHCSADRSVEVGEVWLYRF